MSHNPLLCDVVEGANRGGIYMCGGWSGVVGGGEGGGVGWVGWSGQAVKRGVGGWVVWVSGTSVIASHPQTFF